MEDNPPIEKPKLHPVLVFLVAGGLSLMLGFVFSLLTCAHGFLFSGVDTLMAVVASGGAGALVTAITASVCNRIHRRFSWLGLTVEALLVAVATVGFVRWTLTRDHLRIFFKPAPVPQQLKVLRGRSNMFSSFVHFTGPPELIASVLVAKGLVEIPAEPTEGSNHAGFWERERFARPWDWWQPTAMSSPRFFFREYPGAAQGWTVGWRVNGATNEVYAYISG